MSVIKVRVAPVERREEFLSALAIRRKVFQEEQGVDPALDLDGKDGEAQHFLSYCNNMAGGTARVRYFTDNHLALARIERVAVLPEFRRHGVGKVTAEYILNFLKLNWVDKADLIAQERVKGFYEKIGFRPIGRPFEKAGILHIAMEIYMKDFFPASSLKFEPAE